MNIDELHTTAMEIRMLATVVTKTTRRALEQRLDLANAGVSRLQYGIMHALSCKEWTISELSHRFMLDPSTLVPAVDALERKGLAKQAPLGSGGAPFGRPFHQRPCRTQGDTPLGRRNPHRQVWEHYISSWNALAL